MMTEITPVTGRRGGECFLVSDGSAAFLVDTGYAFCAEETVGNIEKALGGRGLDYILITHSHYDHVGGLERIKRRWPSARTAASRHAADIFARDGARQLMRSLDATAAEQKGCAPAAYDYTEGLAADIIVGEGDELKAGGMTAGVMNTPGHTRCSVNYYFKEADIMALSETNGVRISREIVTPAFVVAYRISLEAIERAISMSPGRLIVSHHGEVAGEEAAEFLDKALAAAKDEAEFVMGMHRSGAAFEEIMKACTERHYKGRRKEYQPQSAFEMNQRAMLAKLIEELGGENAPSEAHRPRHNASGL
ncbi:MAG: MBL fold metallo-hydrolase [Clostridiales Family XIII bacterium]|jgi:glyoxylase-like metal-dependent hydrolase (beta-lactamase superfamily II)|nr:MBL fold metallo-hydrolase [Clostridiales Family XIII bacterium]